MVVSYPLPPTSADLNMKPAAVLEASPPGLPSRPVAQSIAKAQGTVILAVVLVAILPLVPAQDGPGFRGLGLCNIVEYLLIQAPFFHDPPGTLKQQLVPNSAHSEGWSRYHTAT